MLRGHQTLQRIVGKRRRLAPRPSVSPVRAPQPPRPPWRRQSEAMRRALTSDLALKHEWAALTIFVALAARQGLGAAGDAGALHDVASAAGGPPETEWLQPAAAPAAGNGGGRISCPVCGLTIAGFDSAINEHIDECLASGGKPAQGAAAKRRRRTRQVTLAHFGSNCSFGTTQLVPGQSDLDSPSPGACDGSWAPPASSLAPPIHDNGSDDCAAVVDLAITTSVRTAQQHLEQPLLRSAPCSCECHGVAPPADDGEQSDTIDDRELANDQLAETLAMALETSIVGRRFRQSAACHQGLAVRLEREPGNSADPNSIFVLLLDLQVVQDRPAAEALVLGHVPRAVALHLAPILQTQLVSVQGVVMSTPKRPTGPAAITLSCMANGSLQLLDVARKVAGSWQAALEAAKAEGSPSSSSESSDADPRASGLRAVRKFALFLTTVLERDGHLFDKPETTFLTSFMTMPEDAQLLFERLFHRKGPWLRVASFQYPAVEDITQAVATLEEYGYITAHNIASLAAVDGAEARELLEVLPVPALRDLAASSNLKLKQELATARRDELLLWLAAACSDRTQKTTFGDQSGLHILEGAMEVAGLCIRISDRAAHLLWRVQRLFFLNGEQHMGVVMLANLGHHRYPSYICRRSGPIFLSRSALLDYEKALEHAQAMDEAMDAGDEVMGLTLLQEALASLSRMPVQHHDLDSNDAQSGNWQFRSRFTASYVLTAIGTLGISLLEKQHRYDEAVRALQSLLAGWWCTDRRGYWFVRLAVDLGHLGRKEESLSVAEAGVDDPWVRGGDRVALQRRVVRLSRPPRRWRPPHYAAAVTKACPEIRILGRPLNCEMGVKSRFYGFDNQQCGVEQLALQHYAREEGNSCGGGWCGVHCEGGVWLTLFGLLLWDVLFSDVPDVFQTPFQTAPLDLNTDAFFTARRELIDRRLEEVRQGEGVRLLTRSWRAHHGVWCAGVNWERHSLTELQTIAGCIGGPGLAGVCRLLAEDHGGWAGGMPDLLLWRTATNDKGQALYCCLCGCRSENCKSCAGVGDAKLVEVKGPRDSLSEQQRAWIAALLASGLHVEVCKVVEVEPCGGKRPAPIGQAETLNFAATENSCLSM
eukprot:SM000167S02978  [mRNA]  locus=s167:251131:256223:- [translate_table: standard]